MASVIPLATACSVVAYIVGWWLGFRFAANRCPDCGETREGCVCVTLEPWDDEDV